VLSTCVILRGCAPKLRAHAGGVTDISRWQAPKDAPPPVKWSHHTPTPAGVAYGACLARALNSMSRFQEIVDTPAPLPGCNIVCDPESGGGALCSACHRLIYVTPPACKARFRALDEVLRRRRYSAGGSCSSSATAFFFPLPRMWFASFIIATKGMR
jgi:hypothetical protein